MAKINLLVKYSLRNLKNEYNIRGIYKDNVIKYKDNDSIIVINLNNNILEKYKNGENILFDFNDNKCYIDDCYININVIKLINKNKLFYVKYKIDKNLFEISIKMI